MLTPNFFLKHEVRFEGEQIRNKNETTEEYSQMAWVELVLALLRKNCCLLRKLVSVIRILHWKHWKSSYTWFALQCLLCVQTTISFIIQGVKPPFHLWIPLKSTSLS